MTSILCLHLLTPRTVLRSWDVIVPILSHSASITELASDTLWLNHWISSHHTRLPCEVAEGTWQACLIDLIITALAISLWQLLDIAIFHAHTKDPISYVVSFISTNDILLRKWNIERTRNVSFLEVWIVCDTSTLWILNGIIKINVSIEEHEGHINDSFSSVGFTSV